MATPGPEKVVLTKLESQMVWSLAASIINTLSRDLHQPPGGDLMASALDQALQSFLELRDAMTETGRMIKPRHSEMKHVFMTIE